MKDWVDLKLRHTQLQVRAQIDKKVRELVVLAIVGGLAGAAGLFLLIAIALGFGRWTGFPSAGFAIVALLLLVGAGGVWLVRRRFTDHEQKVAVPLESVAPSALPAQTHASTSVPVRVASSSVDAPRTGMPNDLMHGVAHAR